MIRLSVIIAASRPSELAACLDGLSRQTAPMETLQVVIAHKPGFRMPPIPVGLAAVTIESADAHPNAKRALGAAAAAGELLAFLDDDTVPPPGWAAAVLAAARPDARALWGGPNRDLRAHWRVRLAQAVQSHPLLEGLASHRALRQAREVGPHDLPLCNLVIPAALFRALGGLSVALPYTLDDVDFNTRARRAGARLILDPSLAVQHNLRPLLLPYLGYKWRTRFAIGRLFPQARALYADAWQLRLVSLTWWVLPVALLAGWLQPVLLVAMAACYAAAAAALFGARLRDPAVALFGVPLLLATHLVTYCGYTLGRLTAGRAPAAPHTRARPPRGREAADAVGQRNGGRDTRRAPAQEDAAHGHALAQ